MKYLVLLTLLFLSTSQIITKTNNAKDEFTLNGKVVGKMNGYVHIEYSDKNGKRVNDSTLLKNGRFNFKGHITEPSIAFLTGPAKSRRADDLNSTLFFLEPGVMWATLEVDNFKHGKIRGSTSQSQFAAFNRQRDAITNKWKSKLDSLKASNVTNESAKAKAREQLLSLYSLEDEGLIFSFIKQHPDSYVSVYLFGYCNFTLDSLKMFYNGLSSRIKQSTRGKRIADDINKKERITVGKMAPEFTQNDCNGKTVSLRDFRGKYVLVEFWASWCTPCRAENPNLVKIYDHYKDKNFTIIGVSLDDERTRDAWLAAIKKDGLPWTQVSDLRGINNEVAIKYNVLPIPSNFLIDPNGKIIATDLIGENLKTKLEEVIK